MVKNKGNYCVNHNTKSAYILGLCRPCYEKHRRTRNPAQHEATKARMRAWGVANQKETHLRQNYGLTLAEYNRLLTEQKNKCAICFESMAKVNVDHCHTTGKVRGLLCSHCNLAIGHLRENINNFMNGVLYLQKHK